MMGRRCLAVTGPFGAAYLQAVVCMFGLLGLPAPCAAVGKGCATSSTVPLAAQAGLWHLCCCCMVPGDIPGAKITCLSTIVSWLMCLVCYFTSYGLASSKHGHGAIALTHALTHLIHPIMAVTPSCV
jgi:hypothetical protein